MTVRPQNILCVDDDGDILQIARMSLEAVGGFSARTASSGAEAIRMIQHSRPDILLLDVMMPVLDGPSTLKILQAMELSAGLPVIFMTARAQPHEISEYIAAGATGVIPKPFDPMTLPQDVMRIWKEFHKAAH